MKSIAQVFLLLMIIMSAGEFINDKQTSSKPYYLAGTVIFTLLIVVIQRFWN